MPVKLIDADISTQILTFKPGGSPTSLKVSVVNNSNQFASFQLEIVAAGVGSDLGSHWYSISPAISTKKPPGDSTDFYVTIVDSPVAGFVGKMNLIVRIFSIELRDEDRQILRLIVEPGIDSMPMQLELPLREFSLLPESAIEIPVEVFNPSQNPAYVSLRFSGNASKWIDNVERQIQINPGAKVKTAFVCQLPVTLEVPSQTYSFTIEATHRNGVGSSSPEGLIKVLPAGFVDFSPYPTKQQIPPSRLWLPQWRINSATYQLKFQNGSNLNQTVRIEISKEEEEQGKCLLDITPETLDLKPGQTDEIKLLVRKRRRWFGAAEKLSFRVLGIVTHNSLNVNNENQILNLTIYPILHPWLQLGLALLLAIILWGISWLNPYNPLFWHGGSVNSIQFSGLGLTAVSGSADQSIIRWYIPGFEDWWIDQNAGKIAEDVGKSVRVVRFRPVDNNVIAAGLENGEIQLWEVLGDAKKPESSFSVNKGDRVLDVKFTQDGHYLFSGHGSGAVMVWNVDQALLSHDTNIDRPVQKRLFNFTIYGLTLVGQEGHNLVIGGRYNSLVMWNWKQNKLQSLPYQPLGGQEDYIVSLSSAEYKPYLLATADNQGQITLWNMQPCLNGNGECQVLSQWSDGHGGKPVRSLALSNDGCYLVSGGDDNRVWLWPLTKEGKRSSTTGTLVFSEDSFFDRLLSASRNYNSVDIKIVNKHILVIAGNQDRRVHYKKLNLDPNSECSH